MSPPGRTSDDAAAGRPVPALLTVTLNGTATAEPVLFLRGRDGTLYASAEAFAGWHIRLPRGEPTRFEGALYYPLASLPGLNVRLDEGAQAVMIDLSASGFEAQRTSLAQASQMPMTMSSTGAFVGYDVFVEHTARADQRQRRVRGGGLYPPRRRRDQFHRPGGRQAGARHPARDQLDDRPAPPA